MFSLIKKFIGYILTVIIALVLAISVPLYVTANFITDRDNVKIILTSEDIQAKYSTYITQLIVKDTKLNLLDLVINTDDVESIIQEEVSDEWITTSIGSAVDSTYDWLEGKTEEPQIQLAPDVDDLNDKISENLNDKLGLLSYVIDLSNLELLNQDAELFDLNNKAMTAIPMAYQQLILLPKRLLIINGVLLLLLVFSSKTMRQAMFFTGLSIGFAGLTILYGPQFIDNNPQVLERFDIPLDELPQKDDLPEFLQDTWDEAQGDIVQQTTIYAWAFLIGGVVLVVISQLELKEVEVLDWAYRGEGDGEETDEEGEEIEE